MSHGPGQAPGAWHDRAHLFGLAKTLLDKERNAARIVTGIRMSHGVGKGRMEGGMGGTLIKAGSSPERKPEQVTIGRFVGGRAGRKRFAKRGKNCVTGRPSTRRSVTEFKLPCRT